jgi:uncharacterized protein YcgI (DUF1989 family)
LPPFDAAFYNAARSDLTKISALMVPPRDARAFRVPAGHLLRIVSVEGPQVGDLNLWHEHDLSERFFSGKTRALHATHVPVRPGDFIEFFAEIALLGAISTCPGGDCSAGHSDDTANCYPLKVEIYRPTDGALAGWQSPLPNAYSRSHGIA